MLTREKERSKERFWRNYIVKVEHRDFCFNIPYDGSNRFPKAEEK